MNENKEIKSSSPKVGLKLVFRDLESGVYAPSVFLTWSVLLVDKPVYYTKEE